MTLIIDLFCVLLFTLSLALHVLPFTNVTQQLQSHYSEAGIVESASLIVLIIAVFQCFYISKTQCKNKNTYWYFLIGVFVFLIGEELSWFQRVFNLEVPDFFLIWNDQQEINLHGLNHQDIFIETLLIPVFAVCFLPLFLRSSWKIRIRLLIIAVLEISLLFQVDQPLKESFLEEGIELISYIQFTQILSLYLTNRTPTPNPRMSLVTGL